MDLGEYSAHRRIPLSNTSWQQLSSNLFNGEPHYQVTRGQTVYFVLNHENNGRDTQYNIPINFYLSIYSNGADDITTSDIFLKTTQVTLSRDVPDKLYISITIPYNVTNGFFRLGAIINPQNNTPNNEFDNRNASYVGINIVN